MNANTDAVMDTEMGAVDPSTSPSTEYGDVGTQMHCEEKSALQRSLVSGTVGRRPLVGPHGWPKLENARRPRCRST